MLPFCPLVLALPQQIAGAKRLSSLGGVEYLADLLAGGDPWLRWDLMGCDPLEHAAWKIWHGSESPLLC